MASLEPERCGWTVQEWRDALQKECHIGVIRSAVNRAMLKQGWRLKMSLTASEADGPELKALRATMVEPHQVLCAAENMVFVDESGTNIRYLRCKRSGFRVLA
jgi:hypothetical protein